MATTAMTYPVLHSVVFLAMLAVCFAAPQCTADSSSRNTNVNSVCTKITGGTAGSLPSGNSGISNVLGAAAYYRLKAKGLLGAGENGSGLTSRSTANSNDKPTGQTEGQERQDQTPSVTTTTNTNGELNNGEDSRGSTKGTPGSSDPPPTVHGDGGHVDNAPRSVLPAPPPPPVSGDPLPNSENDNSVDQSNDADGRDNDALTGDVHDAAARAATEGDHKGSEGQDSDGLLSPRTEISYAATPATTTTTTKPVKTDANKETLTRDGSGGSSGSQSLSPPPQNPTSNGTPAAKLTRAHTTEPAKSGEDQPSVKVTTTNTSTNRATQPAQERAAANQTEQDTNLLQTLKSTTSTAAPTDSKQTSTTSATEFAKEKSTDLPTSLPKLSKALQSLDMKDSSIGISAFFTLSALSTLVMMALAPAC